MLDHMYVPNWASIYLETTLSPLLKNVKRSAAINSSGDKWHSLSPLLSPTLGKGATVYERKIHIFQIISLWRCNLRTLHIYFIITCTCVRWAWCWNKLEERPRMPWATSSISLPGRRHTWEAHLHRTQLPLNQAPEKPLPAWKQACCTCSDPMKGCCGALSSQLATPSVLPLTCRAQ